MYLYKRILITKHILRYTKGGVINFGRITTVRSVNSICLELFGGINHALSDCTYVFRDIEYQPIMISIFPSTRVYSSFSIQKPNDSIVSN